MHLTFSVLIKLKLLKFLVIWRGGLGGAESESPAAKSSDICSFMSDGVVINTQHRSYYSGDGMEIPATLTTIAAI